MSTQAFGTILTTDLIDPDARQEFDAVVAPSGGDYTSVGAAVAAGENTIWVKAGTYDESAGNITLTGAVEIVGEDFGPVVLDFGGTAFGIVADGNGGVRETAGTITATSGSAAIVGVGTTFTNLSPGDFLFIDGNGIPILSIGDALNLTLAFAYEGNTRAGISTWWGETLINGIGLRNLSIINTTGSAINMRQVTSLALDAVNPAGCGAAGVPSMVIEQCFGVTLRSSGSVSSNGPGMEINECSVLVADFVGAGNAAEQGVILSGANQSISMTAGNIRACGAAGLEVQGTGTEISVTDFFIVGNDGKGIDIFIGAGSVAITDCQVSLNNGAGVDIDGTDCTVTNNHITDNVGPGILGGPDASIEGNQIRDNTGIGIDLAADTHCAVTGNRCIDNGGDGINIDDVFNATDNTVSANVCQGNTGNGIRVAGDNNIVNANRCDGNGGDGILITAAGNTNIVTSNHCAANTGGNVNDLGVGTVAANNI